MKILVISDAWKPQINGVVRTYEHLGEELSAMGHDMRVIGPADFPLRIPLPGYPEIELALGPYGRLSRMMEDAAPDAIHIATEGPLGQAARRYCKRNNLRFTTAYHTHFPDYIARRVARFLPILSGPVRKAAIAGLRDFHNSASGIFTATASLEDELKSWGFSSPMHRLARGARLDIFRPGTAEKFEDLARPVALFVGRVAVEKNLEAFLDMEWPGTKVVVGNGPDLAMLRHRYPAAIFAGSREGEDLGAHYRSADIFVFPSRTDTFGMVLVEALASGLPVAAYNVTGPRDIITEPHLGALHDDDLGRAAAAALNLAHLGDERRRHVEENYSWRTIARDFLNVLIRIGK